MHKSTTQLILIANIAKESAPAGQMTLLDNLFWCETLWYGRKIDVVLSHLPNQEAQDHGYTIVQRDLCALNNHWRHDRHKLKHALLAFITTNYSLNIMVIFSLILAKLDSTHQ